MLSKPVKRESGTYHDGKNMEHIELVNIYRGKTSKGILFAVKNLGSKFSIIF